MASISELNVRLGLLTKEFDSSLKRVERDFKASGKRLSATADSFSYGLTAPTLAFGASAVVAAGQIESLKLAMRSTFESAGRSMSDADAELKALRKSALAPGLDFEQAVKGSIRLQGVGDSAESARKTIDEMANAISMTGGTAANLDSVTVQMSQMISKGKILSQDLRIIQENMPIVSRLMQEAFGTSNADNLQKLGITGKEFVDRITAEAAKLPRVAGGISNAIVNAGSALKNFMAGIGEEISKVLDFGGKSDQLSEALQRLSDWFKNLDGDTKRSIVQYALMAAAIGPVLKVLAFLETGIASVISTVRTLSTVTGFLGGQLKLLAVLAGTAAAVYFLFSDRLDTAAFASKKFADAKARVAEESAKEVGALNKNIDALRNINSTTGQREGAIKALTEAYPNYLQGMNLEKASMEDLNKIQKDLTANIIRGIAERQKATAINSIYEEQAKILLRIQQIRDSGNVTTSEATLIDTGDMIKAGGTAAAVIEKLKAQVDGLGRQATVSAGEFDRAFGLQNTAIDASLKKEYDARAAADEMLYGQTALGDQAIKTGKTIADLTGSTAEHTKAAKEAAKADADFWEEMDMIADSGLSASEQLDKATLSAIKMKDAMSGGINTPLAALPQSTPTEKTFTQASPLGSAFDTTLTADPASALTAIQSVQDAVRASGDEFTATGGKIRAAGEIGGTAWQQMADGIFASQETINAFADGISSVSEALTSVITDGASAWSSASKMIVESISKVISMLIKQFVATLMTKSAASAPGPIGLAIAGAVGALGGALFKKLVGGIGFAEGGVVTKPTFAMVGEYPGAARNPEIITPENKLRSIFNESAGGGGRTEVYGVLRGADILLSSERAQNDRNRVR